MDPNEPNTEPTTETPASPDASQGGPVESDSTPVEETPATTEPVTETEAGEPVEGTPAE